MNTTWLPFYNPRETDPEILEKLSVGREPLVQQILEHLRNQIPATQHQHWIIRGARGFGKTHLTGLLHHRIQKDESLNQHYLPLWMAETDVYEMYSTGSLLLSIAENLRSIIESTEPAKAKKFQETLDTIEGLGDDEGFYEEVLDVLEEELEARQRKLVVFLENLDALFAGFSKRAKGVEMRRLRHLLQHSSHLLFISTTPTHYLKELSDPKQPMYGLLREHYLSKLDETQMHTLFENIVELTEREEIRTALLGNHTSAIVRRKVIYHLTGGIPRSLIMLAQVISGGASISDTIQDFYRLLDTQTAYFEERLSRLAPRERTVLTRMALHDENLTTKEIAALTRLSPQSLPTQVKRLEEEGHLEKTSGKGGRGTIYGIADGMFRLWYQYRKGRETLDNLVEFLSFWFGPEELQAQQDYFKEMLEQQAKSQLSTRWLNATLKHLEKASEQLTLPEFQLKKQELWEYCESEQALQEIKTLEQLWETLTEPQEFDNFAERAIVHLERWSNSKNIAIKQSISANPILWYLNHISKNKEKQTYIINRIYKKSSIPLIKHISFYKFYTDGNLKKSKFIYSETSKKEKDLLSKADLYLHLPYATILLASKEYEKAQEVYSSIKSKPKKFRLLQYLCEVMLLPKITDRKTSEEFDPLPEMSPGFTERFISWLEEKELEDLLDIELSIALDLLFAIYVQKYTKAFKSQDLIQALKDIPEHNEFTQIIEQEAIYKAATEMSPQAYKAWVEEAEQVLSPPSFKIASLVADLQILRTGSPESQQPLGGAYDKGLARVPAELRPAIEEIMARLDRHQRRLQSEAQPAKDPDKAA